MLSINASVKERVTHVKGQDMLTLLRHVPMDEPSSHSL